MVYEILKFDKYEAEGGKGSYDRGVLSITLSKWSEFYEEVRQFRDYKDYVWRGQRRGYPEWELKAKIDREHTYKNEKERDNLKDEQFKEFLKAIRGRRGVNPPELKEDELWALGQHHGLKTPLLDWTESPFVAAFFAFVERIEDKKQNEGKRVVFGLNRDIKRWKIIKIQPNRRVKSKFVEFPPIESHENMRFLAQSCVLTKSLEGQDMKKWLQRFYSEKRHKNRIILVEISIGESEREKCLRDLNMMNINHASLFPDIEGAAKFCNMKLEINKY